MFNIWLFIIFIFPGIFSKQLVGNNTCNGSAKCIPLSECEEIKFMLNDDVLLNYARSFVCGYFHEPLVCCDRNCTTPNGNYGRAISLDDCPHLKANEYNRRKDKRDFLLESRIGEEGIVCCNTDEDNYKIVEPAPIVSDLSMRENSPKCTTPNGETASCVPIDHCEAYAKVEEDTDENFRFLNDSYCGYWEKPLVCCGSNYLYSEKYEKNLPESFECGEWDPKQHSGVPPWLAIVQIKNTSRLCVGALINAEYVISTTACAGEKEDLEVTIGKCINNSTRVECDFKVKEFITFPLHRYHRAQDTGIVLLKLTKTAKPEDDYIPICLPKSVLATNVNINIIGIEQKDAKWSGSISSHRTGYNGECHEELQTYLERIICIETKDLCNNSNIPLLQRFVLRQDIVQQWYLEGLINEEDCYGRNKKSFFHAISVYKFLPWIKSNIK